MQWQLAVRCCHSSMCCGQLNGVLVTLLLLHSNNLMIYNHSKLITESPGAQRMKYVMW